MIIFTESIDIACSIAVAFRGISYNGRLVMPADLAEKRNEIHEAVQKAGYILFDFNGTQCIAVWADGELVRLCPPAAYGDDYEKVKNTPAPFFPAQMMYEPVPGKEKRVEQIIQIFNEPKHRRIYHIVTGTNSDRIFTGIYALYQTKKPFVRIRPASLSREDLTTAFSEISENRSMCWFFSQLTRRNLYWLSATNLTRIGTAAYQMPMDIRVKTVPALAILVDRDRETKRGSGAQEYVVQLRLTTENGEKFFVSPSSRKNGRFPSENAAKKHLERYPLATVVDKLTVDQKIEWPAGALNQQNVIDLALKEYYKEPSQTKEILKRLYENGFISNPDTMSHTYPAGQETRIRENLMRLEKTKTFSDLFDKYTFQKISGQFFSKETPGIYITGKLPDAACDKDSRDVYKLIALAGLKTMLPPKKTETKKVSVKYAGILFGASSTKVLQAGFTVLDKQGPPSEQLPADLAEDAELSVEYIIKKTAAAPKQPYTWPQFVNILTRENKKLGVSFASQIEADTILSSLTSHGYASIKGKQLLPTDKGIIFIRSLYGMDSLLDMGTMFNWEGMLKRIEEEEDQEKAAMLANTLLQKGRETIKNWCETLSRSAGIPSQIPCPVCGENMYNTAQSYFCRKCGYRLAVQQFGRVMEPKTLAYLCIHKQTPMLYGFIHGGNSVWARLSMDHNMKINLSLDSEYLCPVCGKPLRIAPGGDRIHCRDKCSFSIPTTVYGHRLKKKELLPLFSNARRTPIIYDLHSGGNSFCGYFVLGTSNTLQCIVVKEEEDE